MLPYSSWRRTHYLLALDRPDTFSYLPLFLSPYTKSCFETFINELLLESNQTCSLLRLGVLNRSESNMHVIRPAARSSDMRASSRPVQCVQTSLSELPRSTTTPSMELGAGETLLPCFYVHIWLFTADCCS